MPGDDRASKRRRKLEGVAQRIGGSVPESAVPHAMVQENHVEHAGGSGGAADEMCSSSHSAEYGSQGEMGQGGDDSGGYGGEVEMGMGDDDAHTLDSDSSVSGRQGEGCGEWHVNPSVLKNRQRRALMIKLGGNALPPMLHADGNSPMQMAVFALPAFMSATESKAGVGRSKARLDVGKWTLPGVTRVLEQDGTSRHVWFCNCSPDGVCIKRTAEALHTMAGGCSDVHSAACDCVQYCQSVLIQGDRDVEEIIRISPTYLAPYGAGEGCYFPCALPPPSL
jgi:hypothetical protein